MPSDPLELARLRRAIDIFPPRPVADFLISVCISHGCDLFFYFDQAQLLEEIDEFYSQPTSALRNDLIFVCLALATLALGSQWTTLEKPECPAPLTRLDDGNPGRVFFDRARALVPDLMERSCIRSIQATFILGVYTLPASAISSSYVYMGLALRKALAADLHQKTDESSLDEREKEIRCRLWWSIFSLERYERPRTSSVSLCLLNLQNNYRQVKQASISRASNHYNSSPCTVTLTGQPADIRQSPASDSIRATSSNT